MSTFDSGNVKLDPVDARLRSFGIRLTAAEKLFTHVTRVNAAPGPSGKDGVDGNPGAQGLAGPVGPMPEHRWEGTSLQFQQGPDGDTWGDAVNLQGPQGLPGMNGGVVMMNQNSFFPAGW